jgi:hypothetical protein
MNGITYLMAIVGQPSNINVKSIERQYWIEVKSMEYKQQKQALELLRLFVNSDNQIFRFSGYSGTGKSYTIAQFVSEYHFSNADNLIAAIAPSHKAKRNLETMLAGIANIDTATIASFLGLSPKLDETTGKVAFESREANFTKVLPSDYDLVIVDEYSMIGKEQVLALISECKKLIFVGDPAQLPPIGEDLSYACSLKCPSYQLTDVVRYSGDLARIAESWRDDIPVDAGNGVKVTLKRIGQPLPIEQTFDDSIISMPKIEWIEQYSKDVEIAIKNDNHYYCKLVTFTNKCANKWNSWVRSEIWDNDEPYNIGDRLLCKKPLFRQNARNGKLEIAVANSTEFTVIGNYSICEIEIYYRTYAYHVIPCRDDEGMRLDLCILNDESKKLQSEQLKVIADTAKKYSDKKDRSKLWHWYYLLSQTFDDISFAYAITTHKAQGSTYDNLYPDIIDLMKCPARKKIIYTALTRSKQAYIYR